MHPFDILNSVLNDIQLRGKCNNPCDDFIETTDLECVVSAQHYTVLSTFFDKEVLLAALDAIDRQRGV
jgi:hypothetical protein